MMMMIDESILLLMHTHMYPHTWHNTTPHYFSDKNTIQPLPNPNPLNQCQYPCSPLTPNLHHPHAPSIILSRNNVVVSDHQNLLTHTTHHASSNAIYLPPRTIYIFKIGFHVCLSTLVTFVGQTPFSLFHSTSFFNFLFLIWKTKTLQTHCV